MAVELRKGGFVSVPDKFKSRSGGGYGGSSSGSSSVTISGTDVKINGVGYSVKPSDYENFFNQQKITIDQNIRNQIFKAQEQARIQEEIKRQEEIKQEQRRQELVIQEKRRIDNLRSDLERRNAREKIRTTRDKQTGDIIRRQILIDNRNKERILQTTNQRTGVTTTRTFQRSGGGGVRETGGLTEFKKNESKQTPQEYFKEIINQNLMNGKSKLPEKYYPFVSEFSELAKALDKSKKGGIIKETLKVPLKIISNFVPTVWTNLKQTPAGITYLVSNPTALKDIPKNMIEDASKTVILLKTNPNKGIAKVGSDYFTFKFIGGAFKITGKVSNSAYNKLNPFLRKFENGKLKINIPQQTFIRRGKEVFLNTRGVIPFVTPTSKAFYKSGQFVKFQKTSGLTLKAVKKIPTESLKKQIQLAGKPVVAVSAIADSIVGLIRRSKVVRKPITALESKLPIEVKRLLSKFDNGTINSRELIKLDNLLKKNGIKGILERSFFADPRGRVRLSRLGLEEIKEGSFYDLLTGKATLKSAKPQILVLKTVLDKLPPSMKDIKNAFEKGIPLTSSQSKRYLLWQQKITGKAKPVGFPTLESEITLAPGEVVKRVKKLATVVVNGKRVPIILIKIVKPTKATASLIKKARVGKATASELRILSRRLKRETGLDYSTSIKNATRRYPVLRKLSSYTTKQLSKAGVPKRYSKSKIKYSKSSLKYTKYGRPYVITPYGARFIKIGSPKYPPTKYPPEIPLKYPPSKYPPKRTPKTRTQKKKPPIIIKLKPLIKLKNGKQINSYDVYARPLKRKGSKKIPKLIKVNKVPLTKARARDLRNYVLDTSLSRTGQIVPNSAKPKSPKLRIPLGYNSRTNIKFRRFKIKAGKRRALSSERVIEKRGRTLDTLGEKQRITLERRIAMLNRSSIKPIRRTTIKRRVAPKRKISPERRRQLIKQLEKARKLRRR